MILLGGTLIVPAVVPSGLAIALDWPLAVVFAGFAVIGLSIGFVSTAGLTLLQAGSAASEMGRTNAAHQFIRTLCITYGVALGGAILLLVVDRRVGDIDAVREVLAGNDVELGAETAGAIGAGWPGPRSWRSAWRSGASPPLFAREGQPPAVAATAISRRRDDRVGTARTRHRDHRPMGSPPRRDDRVPARACGCRTGAARRLRRPRRAATATW